MADSPTFSLLHLPPDIRTLVEFFDDDDRPSAVLDAGESADVLYKNPAFEGLDLRERDVRELLNKAGKDRDGGGTHIAGVNGKNWKVRHVGKSWKVLVGDKQSYGRQAESRINGDGPANGNGHDWTRSPVAGLSPWVEYVRTFDWASTALGPMHSWPNVLRGYVLHVMNNPNARFTVWGEKRTVIYNEACIPLFGYNHPKGLGKPMSESCAELWTDIGPIIEASSVGKVVKLDKMHLSMQRNGSLEETYWDFVAIPIPGDESGVAGQFVELTEVTNLVTGERRRHSILRLSQAIDSAESLQGLWRCFVKALESAVEDVPFALFYLVDEGGDETSEHSTGTATKKCALQGTVGVSTDNSNVPDSFKLEEPFAPESGIAGPCFEAWRSRNPVTMNCDDGTLPEDLQSPLQGRAFGDKIKSALISPITLLGGAGVHGILVLGSNPRSPLDEGYRIYRHFLADILTKAASLISLPEEQRRGQKIADDMNSALAQQLHLITDQAERKEAKFLRMASAAPTGMFVYDPEGRPFYVNEAYLRTLGETEDHHSKRSADAVAWQDHVHPDDLPRFVSMWRNSVEQKAPVTIEHRLKKPWTSVDKASGQEISGETWLLANAFPEVDSDGKVSSIQGWLTNISHRKFTESLLAKRLEEALENKRQTENFIDMTSHEMRNPLSAILQSADSIVSTFESSDMPALTEPITLAPDTSSDIMDAAHTIILCAQHQKRIVDDILTLSKLDASLLEISPDKINAPMMLDKALKMYEAEISRAEITAKIVVEPTYHDLNVETVILDPSRLLQVVINLLTNAIKFTQYSENREITICLGASYERPTGRHHGVTFIPTKHPRKAESPLAEWGDGEILYLQIAVTDTGRGLTEDDIKVLFQRFSQANPKTYKQYGGSGLGLFISRELCELQGGQIGVSSGDGKTSFTFFVRAKRWVPDAPREKSHRPTLPRFTSTSASPVAFNRRGSVPLKEPSNAGEQPLSRSVSINEEPSTPGTASSNTNGDQTDETKSEDDSTELHVLVVDDNRINQNVMAKQLKRAGCVVHVANHGLECLNFLEKSTFCNADVPLSVILLDLEMPIMDGLTAIKTIRERQASGQISGHVPVIAITANARHEQISTALHAGMDQVVTKPFRIPELVPQMHALVHEGSQKRDGG